MFKTALLTAAGLSTAAGAQTVNFHPPIFYDIPGFYDEPSYIDSGDIDNDGDVDLIVDVNGPGNDPTHIFWNNGDGTFTLGPALTAGWGFGQVALGDVDGDSDLDVLRVSYFDNGLYFFRNNGDGTFSTGTYYSGGGGCRAVVFTDFDGDKDLDFVVTDKFGGRIRPYRNINGLGFTSVGLFAAGAQPFGIDAGDVDGDGDEDIVVTNEDDATITVCLNDGTGQFNINRTFAVGQRPVDVTLDDLDGDGWLDAVVANWDALVGTGDTVSVLIGDQDGGFGPHVVYQAGARPESVRTADIDGDGTPDIVVACSVDDQIAVLSGIGDGTFAPAADFSAGNDPTYLTLDDFDADGAIDVAVASYASGNLAVLMNNSDTPVDPPAVEVLWHVGWDNFFNEDTPSHVRVDQDGNIITAGSTYFSANEDDFYLVKFDSSGNMLWEATYNGVGDHYDRIYDLEIDSTGAAVVTGETWNSNFGVEWTTLKLNSDGSTAWARRYLAANSFSQQRPEALAVGSDGRVGVCGYYINNDFDAQFAAVVYDAAGNVLWDRKLPESGTVYGGHARDLAFDSAGNLIATGNMDDDDEFGEEMYTAKFAPDGAVLWAVRHDATSDSFQNSTIGETVYVDSTGSVYVAGSTYSNSTTGNDFLLVKYDATGTLLWSRVESGGGASTAYKLTPLPNGTIVVSGSGGSGILLHAFSSAGDWLWSQTVAASINFINPTGHLTLGTDGNLYILGRAGSDLVVFQVSESGALLSTTEIDSGTATDSPAAIASAPGNIIYALGQYQPEVVNRHDFSLFKLSTGESICAPDLTNDGVLDFFDVAEFLDLFSAQNPLADFAADGVLDFFDVAEFLDQFSQGCP